MSFLEKKALMGKRDPHWKERLGKEKGAPMGKEWFVWKNRAHKEVKKVQKQRALHGEEGLSWKTGTLMELRAPMKRESMEGGATNGKDELSCNEGYYG